MEFIIEYDIAAIILCVAVMLGFFRKRILSTSLTRDFSILGSLVICTSILDIICIHFLRNPTSIPLWTHYLLNILYQIPNHTLALGFSICICSASRRKTSFKSKHVIGNIIYCIPYLIVQLLIVTTPKTHWFFYFDENITYLHGKAIVYSFFVSAFYLIHSLIVANVYRKNLSRSQRTCVNFYTVFVIIAIIIQISLPKLLIVTFVGSLGVMLIFLSLDDPANYLDKTLQTYNRQAFEQVVDQLIYQKKRTRFFALQIKDLDNINDSIGQLNTDTFLRLFTTRMMVSGGRKALFRISGSRFAILLPQDKKKQKLIVDSIHKMIDSPFEIDNFTITPTVAMTYFTYPDDCDSAEDIMAILENTLNEMPASDLGLIVPANPMILEKKYKEFNILQLLKSSVNNQDFQVFYQPIFNIEKQCYTTAEALVRFKNSDNMSLSPEEFIPIAEKNGLIIAIGNIVFRKVCQFIKESNIMNYGIEYIHVNLSVIQCMQPTLADELISIMDEYGVNYKNITFEVTESAAVVSKDTLKQNMAKLLEKGCNFAMDDYGSGYSNNLSLLNFPFKEIKLDKTIVNAAFENEQSRKILKHTMSMVKALNMNVVAEGIESKEIADEIIGMKCDFIQGYYYSRPISAPEFKELMLTKKS